MLVIVGNLIWVPEDSGFFGISSNREEFGGSRVEPALFPIASHVDHTWLSVDEPR